MENFRKFSQAETFRKLSLRCSLIVFYLLIFYRNVYVSGYFCRIIYVFVRVIRFLRRVSNMLVSAYMLRVYICPDSRSARFNVRALLDVTVMQCSDLRPYLASYALQQIFHGPSSNTARQFQVPISRYKLVGIQTMSVDRYHIQDSLQPNHIKVLDRRYQHGSYIHNGNLMRSTTL
jgi:hypothetical protein